MKLEKYLKKLRIENNLSQRYVASKLGYGSSQFVSNWERETCSPPSADLVKLAKLFKVDVVRLIDLRCQDFRESLNETVRGSK